MNLTLRALKGLSTCALSVFVCVAVCVTISVAGCQLSRDEAPAQEEARELRSELTAPPSKEGSRRARGQSFGLGGLSTLGGGGGRAQRGSGSGASYGAGYGRGANFGEASQAQPSTSSPSRRSARRRLARKPKPSKAPMRMAKALMPSAPPPPPPPLAPEPALKRFKRAELAVSEAKADDEYDLDGIEISASAPPEPKPSEAFAASTLTGELEEEPEEELGGSIEAVEMEALADERLAELSKDAEGELQRLASKSARRSDKAKKARRRAPKRDLNTTLKKSSEERKQKRNADEYDDDELSALLQAARDEAPSDLMLEQPKLKNERERAPESAWREPRALRALKRSLTASKPHSFWPKQGYFENTYLGGDLAFESAMKAQPHNVRAHLSSPEAQVSTPPLDPPLEEGVSLSATLSEVSLSEPQRVLLQVGLQGSERYGWRRPPLSVVLLIDPTWAQRSALDLTSTLTPLLNLLSPVDRLGVLSAELSLKELRDVERVRDAMIHSAERASASLSSPHEASRWLQRQLREAGAALEQAARDPHRAPGAQAILLLCDQGCELAREALTQAAHTLNLSGVLTSVLTSSQMRYAELWRIASAGHGGAWTLPELSQEGLRQALRRELERFSRVVARLLRLSVKLERGVELIDIIGSQMLSTQRAQQVKAREVAMDKRLSERLGIKANRGEDDEGVQVVIPAFYGGDRHLITLELWVERPGAVAEVNLKYKDMVRSLNATTSLSAQLSSVPQPRGAAQEEVLRVAAQQRLAVELKAALRGDRQRALSDLLELNPSARALVSALRDAEEESFSLLSSSLLGRGREERER